MEQETHPIEDHAAGSDPVADDAGCRKRDRLPAWLPVPRRVQRLLGSDRAGTVGFDESSLLRLKAGELPTAIQFFAGAGRSGKLVLSRDSVAIGEIYFLDGRMVHGAAGNRRGVPALAALVAGPALEARFSEDADTPEQTIQGDTAHSLLEATVLADEMESGAVEAMSAVLTADILKGTPPWLAFGLRAAFVLSLIATVAYHAASFWGELDDQFDRNRSAQRLDVSKERRMARSLAAARKARDERRYEIAFALAYDVLRFDRDHAEARALSLATIPSVDFMQVVTTKSTAEFLWNHVDGLDPDHGVESARRRVFPVLRRAEELFGLDERRGALETYDEAIRQCKIIIAADRKRRYARAALDLASVSRRRAVDDRAPDLAERAWRNAESFERKARKELDAGRFDESAQLGESAAAEYARAQAQVRDRLTLDLAKAAYQRDLRRIGAEFLGRYNTLEWQKVETTLAEAAGLEEETCFGIAATRWNEARELLLQAEEATLKLWRRDEFTNAMADGVGLLAAGRLEDALAAFAKAASTPGYQDNLSVLDRIEETELAIERRDREQAVARLVSQAIAVQEGGNWFEALRLAGEILALDPESPEGAVLRDRAAANLPPVIEVSARLAGQPVEGARILIDGVRQESPLPCAFTLGHGESYAIEIFLPPRGDIHFTRHKIMHEADYRGLRTLVADLAIWPAAVAAEPWSVPELGISLVPVEPGTIQQQITIENVPNVCTSRFPRPFWIASHETTQADFATILGEDPSHFEGADLPVERVTWHDAVTFCHRLTQREKAGERLPPGYVFRLPTEAEWEYCAEATDEPDTDLADIAWYDLNSGGQPHPVGSRRATASGLYDTRGNVWEWCLDSLSDGPAGVARLTSIGDDDVRIRRGGSWAQPAEHCRGTTRSALRAGTRLHTVGFRVVLAPPVDDLVSEWEQAPAPETTDSDEPREHKEVPALDIQLVPVRIGETEYGQLWISTRPITQRQYSRVLGQNPSRDRGGDRPVESVTWHNAAEFCRRLTASESEAGRIPPGSEFRLPLLAECAGLAGTRGPSAGAATWCLDGRRVDSTGTNATTCRAVSGPLPNAFLPVGADAQTVWLWPSCAVSAIGFRVVLGPALDATMAAGEGDLASNVSHWQSPTVDLQMVPIHAGTFRMGSDSDGTSLTSPHTVFLTKPFWMSRTEITQDVFERVLGRNPSEFRSKNRPVDSVDWDDTHEFCVRLTERERKAGLLPVGFAYRLPTEAEWEYCARAGRSDVSAELLPVEAWCQGNAGEQTHAVGTRAPNPWGLQDMLGNVWEWCHDWSGPYPDSAAADPTGPSHGAHRLYRGGSYASLAAFCSTTGRVDVSPFLRHPSVGFRVVLAPEIAQ